MVFLPSTWKIGYLSSGKLWKLSLGNFLGKVFLFALNLCPMSNCSILEWILLKIDDGSRKHAQLEPCKQGNMDIRRVDE